MMNSFDRFDIKYVGKFLGFLESMIKRDQYMCPNMMVLVLNYIRTLGVEDASINQLIPILKRHKVDEDGIGNIFSDFSITVSDLDLESLKSQMSSQNLDQLREVQVFCEKVYEVMFERSKNKVQAAQRINELLNSKEYQVSL